MLWDIPDLNATFKMSLQQITLWTGEVNFKAFSNEKDNTI